MSGDSNLISIPQVPTSAFESKRGPIPMNISDNMVLYSSLYL